MPWPVRFPGGSFGAESACKAGDLGSSPGKIPLEKELSTHSSIFTWEILWAEETGGLQSMALQESDTT